MEKYNLYTKKVIEHFQNPHNYGKMKNPDGVGKVGNIYCGDVMYLYIKVRKDKKGIEVIKDIKFGTFGCAAAIATSSIITDLAKGKTIVDAIKIKNSDVAESLGGLPPIKMHCSLLAVDALYDAVFDYLSKNKKNISEEFKKKHEKIKKENEKIEKRYKKWIK